MPQERRHGHAMALKPRLYRTSLTSLTGVAPSPHAFLRRSTKSPLNAEERADWMASVRSYCGLPQASCFKAHPERRWRLLSIQELMRLAEAGVSVGAHTKTHSILPVCARKKCAARAKKAMTAWKRRWDSPSGHSPNPSPTPSPTIPRWEHEKCASLERPEFACAFLNVEHWNVEPTDPFVLSRTHVTRGTALPELGASEWDSHTLRARRRKPVSRFSCLCARMLHPEQASVT